MNFNNTEHCLWGSCPERSLSTAIYTLLYLCVVAVVLLTVCGNLLIVISVCHFKQLHTPTNMLILSLAVSDCLVGVFLLPAELIWMIESCWIFSASYRICYTFMSYFLTGVSIFNVALIAVDRYLALSNPFMYNKTVSVSKMCIVLLSVWILLFLYNLIIQYYIGSFEDFVMCLGSNFYIMSLVDLVLTFVFPLSVIIIFYGQVFFIAKKHATAIRELNSHTRNQTSKNMSDSMKSERKAAKVLGILVSVFVACLLPCFVYTVLGNVVEIEEKPLQKVVMMVYLNSSINPVIYALFYPWFRRSVKLILTLHIFYTDSTLINVL
ncbi:trace amine-associated receptor 13c-like [Electrophorus electricus]|uniref:trace amine-associated receptor 13c-like n=1 Tax=Electrophorus electricus TaxID=8005 RepID=UPI0015CFE48E|nr:trace amine-associated receptor 13c-like [Electrophorus electricus]